MISSHFKTQHEPSMTLPNVLQTICLALALETQKDWNSAAPPMNLDSTPQLALISTQLRRARRYCVEIVQ